MKKFISVVLASVMVVAMAAGCSSSSTETAETETTEEGAGEEGKDVYKRQDYGYSKDVFAEISINVEHLYCFCLSFFSSSVGCMAFLPEEFCCS